MLEAPTYKWLSGKSYQPLIALGFLGVGLFTPASLITAIFQSVSREAELLHELKVLGYSVVVEVLQRRKEGVRKREVSGECYNCEKNQNRAALL